MVTELPDTIEIRHTISCVINSLSCLFT